MKRDLTIVDPESDRRALITYSANSWATICIDSPDGYQCRMSIGGYYRRPSAIAAAEAHLRWHANGKPTCWRCGNWLSRKGANRCRRGTGCAVDR
ncbi:hypothetical protein [Actinoplanes sp. NPDC051851]|uniref:hypothetical protein n=1 Tax=Actinoplanes sp. NPDC051851 TaxID=3154753 RepID=UPI00343C2C1C